MLPAYDDLRDFAFAMEQRESAARGLFLSGDELHDAPEGTAGFVLEGGGMLRWVDVQDNYTPAEADQRVTEKEGDA